MSRILMACAAWLAAGSALAEDPVLMSAAWAAKACNAWNADPVLTDELAASGWIGNDKGRGYKVMQVYRNDCGERPTAELRVSLKDGKAMCVYGGAVETAEPDSEADYIMNASTGRWQEMGADEYGPMKAMMLGRLKFSGPYGEAMGNMGPFKNFLLLVGKVPASTASCP
jgi:putative sterol carrier protein